MTIVYDMTNLACSRLHSHWMKIESKKKYKTELQFAMYGRSIISSLTWIIAFSMTGSSETEQLEHNIQKRPMPHAP